MATSRDSQQEINRVKNELSGAGKGSRLRTKGDKFTAGYTKCECDAPGCHRLKQRGSMHCASHTNPTQDK